jgi:hypothetical protein
MTSFTEDRIKEGKNNKNVKIVTATTWETKPKQYSGEKFWVFKGSEHIDPFIEFDESELKGYFEYNNIKTCDIKDLDAELLEDWVRVPIIYLNQFRVDIVRSLADICGIAIGASDKLFKDKPSYYKCFHEDHVLENNRRLYHPFTKQSIVLSYKTPIRLEQYLRDSFNFSSDYAYYVHVDQSLTSDCTGLAVAHKEFNPQRGTIAVLDMVLQILPPPKPDEISVRKVREFILYLREYRGLNISLLTYDLFASAESMQEADLQGIQSERQSVDKDPLQYRFLIDLVYRNAIVGYDYTPLKEELFELEMDRVKNKVDHPPKGSKDVADAVAGAVYKAMTSDYTVYVA